MRQQPRLGRDLGSPVRSERDSANKPRRILIHQMKPLLMGPAINGCPWAAAKPQSSRHGRHSRRPGFNGILSHAAAFTAPGSDSQKINPPSIKPAKRILILTSGQLFADLQTGYPGAGLGRPARSGTPITLSVVNWGVFHKVAMQKTDAPR